MHIWGDGFDFDLLNEAMGEISGDFHALTGKPLWCKEKYGTIRYEFLCMHEPEHLYLLHHIIHAVADSYPEIREEILEDWEHSWDHEAYENQERG